MKLYFFLSSFLTVTRLSVDKVADLPITDLTCKIALLGFSISHHNHLV